MSIIQDIFGQQPLVEEEELLSDPKKSKKNLAVGAAFVGAIAVLLMIAGYVISYVSKEQAYRDKWKDYDDYGWS